jgi:F0F1-type ATP synthase membrane subunit b/b'
MKRLRARFLATILGLVLLSVFAGGFAASSVRAAEPEQSQTDPTETPVGSLFRWINFAVVFGALGYLIVKKAPAAFRARADAIASGISSATAAKTEADAQLRAAEAGLARLDQDAAAMRENAKKDFAAESERLLAAGKVEIERIGHAAEVEVTAARRAARLELRALAARLAAERAATLVPEQITAQQNVALVQKFVDDLPRGAN